MPIVRRVRQHVNPLNERYQTPVVPPDWNQVYTQLQQPLHIDIGCGKGLFAQALATACPDWNVLGLEIREPLVIQALQRPDVQALKNLHFIFCNANNSLRPLLASLPDPQQIQRVSIQFPDPWFKKRHQKRRVVQPELVAVLGEFMPAGAWVWLQSDVEELALAMVEQFTNNANFERQGQAWLPTNPLPAQTDRERVTLDQGKPVYRALFVCTP